MKKNRALTPWVIAAVICMPAVAYAVARPARVLESVAGLACRGQVVCTDDPQRLDEAAALYDDALEFVATSVAPVEGLPLAVFCATPRCYLLAGGGESAARTIGGALIVVSPRGWQPYYLRHELIHRLQRERLGVLGMYRMPEWFIEGMAYSLSDDPRPRLAEPFQSERDQFRAWYAKVGKERLWSAAVGP